MFSAALVTVSCPLKKGNNAPIQTGPRPHTLAKLVEKATEIPPCQPGPRPEYGPGGVTPPLQSASWQPGASPGLLDPGRVPREP